MMMSDLIKKQKRQLVVKCSFNAEPYQQTKICKSKKEVLDILNVALNLPSFLGADIEVEGNE